MKSATRVEQGPSSSNRPNRTHKKQGSTFEKMHLQLASNLEIDLDESRNQFKTYDHRSRSVDPRFKALIPGETTLKLKKFLPGSQNPTPNEKQ